MSAPLHVAAASPVTAARPDFDGNVLRRSKYPSQRVVDPIQVIEDKLRKYPRVRVERGEGFIRVMPEGDHGFRVSLEVGVGRLIVSMEGWHEEFERPDEALECFAFGLSDQARLCVVSRGGFDHRWTLESWDGAAWVPDSTTGLLIFPFWRRSVKRYLQNHLVESARP